MTAQPEIIDVHMHCFTSRHHAPTLLSETARLRAAGVRGMCVVGMVNTRLDQKTMWNLIPDYVENRGNPHFFEPEDLLQLTAHSRETLLPFVDTRHLAGDVKTELSGYITRGFVGIKGIYLPDPENDLGVGNVPDTFGISLKEYQRREWEIFAFAQDNDLPLLYHIDVRRYGDVLTALLADFPKVRVTCPHFGIGRKAFSRYLDRYPNVFTDIAGMVGFIRQDRQSYRDFILNYPDRVCFATDALLYQAEMILDYKQAIKELELPGDVEENVFGGNAKRYLGSALDKKAGDAIEENLPEPCKAARWEIF